MHAQIYFEFVSVLDWLKRIGIESDWMVNYLSCSRTYSWKRMLDAMLFLHKVGYSEEQMHNLFWENPKLLFFFCLKIVCPYCFILTTYVCMLYDDI